MAHCWTCTGYTNRDRRLRRTRLHVVILDATRTEVARSPVTAPAMPFVALPFDFRVLPHRQTGLMPFVYPVLHPDLICTSRRVGIEHSRLPWRPAARIS